MYYCVTFNLVLHLFSFLFLFCFCFWCFSFVLFGLVLFFVFQTTPYFEILKDEKTETWGNEVKR